MFEIVNERFTKAIDSAAAFGKQPVLYCMKFDHGLMKVGRTSNIKERIISACSHGLLVSLFDEVIIVTVASELHANAEARALQMFGLASKQVSKEVFETIDSATAKEILVDATNTVEPCATKDTTSALIGLAGELAKPLVFCAIENAKDFIFNDVFSFLSNVIDDELNDINQDLFLKNHDRLHYLSALAIDTIACEYIRIFGRCGDRRFTESAIKSKGIFNYIKIDDAILHKFKSCFEKDFLAYMEQAA